MLQFTYKLKLTERVKAKCCRHPQYNPEKDGRAPAVPPGPWVERGKLQLQRRSHPYESRIGDRKWAALCSPFLSFTQTQRRKVGAHLVPDI
jgi:hypothetical protein